MVTTKDLQVLRDVILFPPFFVQSRCIFFWKVAKSTLHFTQVSSAMSSFRKIVKPGQLAP